MKQNQVLYKVRCELQITEAWLEWHIFNCVLYLEEPEPWGSLVQN